jgi:hypothetical protein
MTVYTIHTPERVYDIADTERAQQASEAGHRVTAREA